MQTHYTLAWLFSLPLNALDTKGHPNPVTGLSIAALAEHFAASHSKFQKSFLETVCLWPCCFCTLSSISLGRAECIPSVISAFINLAVHSATLILITVFELLSRSWSPGQGTRSQTETSSSPVVN